MLAIYFNKWGFFLTFYHFRVSPSFGEIQYNSWYSLYSALLLFYLPFCRISVEVGNLISFCITKFDSDLLRNLRANVQWATSKFACIFIIEDRFLSL